MEKRFECISTTSDREASMTLKDAVPLFDSTSFLILPDQNMSTGKRNQKEAV